MRPQTLPTLLKTNSPQLHAHLVTELSPSLPCSPVYTQGLWNHLLSPTAIPEGISRYNASNGLCSYMLFSWWLNHILPMADTCRVRSLSIDLRPQETAHSLSSLTIPCFSLPPSPHSNKGPAFIPKVTPNMLWPAQIWTCTSLSPDWGVREERGNRHTYRRAGIRWEAGWSGGVVMVPTIFSLYP